MNCLFLFNLKNRVLANKKILYYFRSLIFTRRDLMKVYRYRFIRARHLNTFFFYLDPSFHHPGLVDRLKAIICCFYIAKLNNYEFRIVFKHPFALEDYLEPNMKNWIAEEKDMDFSIFDTKCITYRGWYQQLKRNKQYICYNYLDNVMPELEEKQRLWIEMYNDLFKPSPKLLNEIANIGLASQSYIAVHLRFVNALEVFEKGNKSLGSIEKDKLIARCRAGIKKICDDNENEIIVVFSDSHVFLKSISDMPVKVLSNKNIRHVKYATNEDDIMKTFLDFMMIQRSKKVYRIIAPEMYKTNFSAFAALVGSAELEDIIV